MYLVKMRLSEPVLRASLMALLQLSPRTLYSCGNSLLPFSRSLKRFLRPFELSKFAVLRFEEDNKVMFNMLN